MNRIIDRKALVKVKLMYDECASCGRPGSNAHHVVQKGAPHFGDDVIANLLVICGSGTMLCHGAFHGSPYVDDDGLRWTQADVALALGIAIAERDDILPYVYLKLGEDPGREFLRRNYYMEVVQ